MAFATTQACCADASCVSVCPVDCIHPTPGEPDFGKTDILYVDPDSCIDCGACADACPVSAIKPIELLRDDELAFVELNAAYYRDRPDRQTPFIPTFTKIQDDIPTDLRIAIVGTGPAASYTGKGLLAVAGDARISFFDRLPMPGGLVRGGVAPDHGETKRFTDVFDWTYGHPRTSMFLNVEVGVHVTHQELLEHYDAVIYGVGARAERALDVPGEELAGVYGAGDVVAWYNGDPDVAADAIDPVSLNGHRAFVVGNGNVALDIARVLLSDPERLGRTEIADHALHALKQRGVGEVVLLGRRGPTHVALTRPELLAMPDGIELCVLADPETVAELEAADPSSTGGMLADLPRIDSLDSYTDRARIVLAFGSSVTELRGDSRLMSVKLTGRIGEVEFPSNLLVRSTGRRGAAIAGLLFDEASGTVPNHSGRVSDSASGMPVSGTYVVGWIKRGAQGGIGANRTCADETIRTLLSDAREGQLTRPVKSVRAFEKLIARRQPNVIDLRRMREIDGKERRRGTAENRPRVKLATRTELLAAGGRKTR